MHGQKCGHMSLFTVIVTVSCDELHCAGVPEETVSQGERDKGKQESQAVSYGRRPFPSGHDPSMITSLLIKCVLLRCMLLGH